VTGVGIFRDFRGAILMHQHPSLSIVPLQSNPIKTQRVNFIYLKSYFTKATILVYCCFQVESESWGNKMGKKVSFQMQNKFAQEAIMALIKNKKLTYSEATVYNFMRSKAFNKKRLCKIDHKFIAKAVGIHKNKMLEKIKKLERLKMLEPIYIINYEGQIIKFYSYKKAVNTFSLSAIQYKNYYIKPVPGELKLMKEASKNEE